MFNSNKRGAITLLIIVGLVLFVLFGLSVYFQTYGLVLPALEKTIEVPQEVKPIKEYVESCMEQAARSAIRMNSLQGGFNDPQVNDKTGTMLSRPLTITTEGDEIPFYIPVYVDAGKNFIPSKEKLESQFTKRMMQSVQDCLDLSQLNYNIDSFPEQLKIVSKMHPDSIIITMTYPLKITIGTTVIEWDFFQKGVKTTYTELYTAAKEYSESQLKDGNNLCLTCMQDLADKYNLFMQQAQFEEYGEILFHKEEGVTIDTEILPNQTVEMMYFLTKEDATGNNITFMFIHFFDLKDEYKPEPENLGEELIELAPIGDVEAEEGYAFTYQVEASGNEINYFDDTEIFEIDENTGLIEFTPEEKDIGDHVVKIAILDNDGNVKSTTMLLSVKEAFNKPIINYIDYLEANVGEEFSYQVVASPSVEGVGLLFYEDSLLFEIDQETGDIEFTPLIEDIGEHIIKITVVDENGYVAIAEMVLIIDEGFEVDDDVLLEDTEDEDILLEEGNEGESDGENIEEGAES